MDDIVLLILDVLGLLLVGSLLTARYNHRPNQLLAAALLCSVLEQHLTVVAQAWAAADSPNLRLILRLPFTMRLFALPFFFLYIRAITNPEQKLVRRDVVHFIPFVLSFAWYVTVRALNIVPLLGATTEFLWERYCRIVLIFGLELFYGRLAVRMVWSYSRRARELVSSPSELRISWLMVLSLILFMFWCLDLLDIVTGPRILMAPFTPYAATLALFALSFFSLRPSPVFNETEAKQTPEKESALPAEQLDRHVKELRQLLSTQSLYLNPELRLSDLATALKLKPYRVSEVINRGMGTTFYDLVNGYRVDRAKQMLLDTQYDHFNLLGIAEECGFRSKSVFNEVFKERAGSTPSEFRKSRAPAVS